VVVDVERGRVHRKRGGGKGEYKLGQGVTLGRRTSQKKGGLPLSGTPTLQLGGKIRGNSVCREGYRTRLDFCSASLGKQMRGRSQTNGNEGKAECQEKGSPWLMLLRSSNADKAGAERGTNRGQKGRLNPAPGFHRKQEIRGRGRKGVCQVRGERLTVKHLTRGNSTRPLERGKRKRN